MGFSKRWGFRTSPFLFLRNGVDDSGDGGGKPLTLMGLTSWLTAAGSSSCVIKNSLKKVYQIFGYVRKKLYLCIELRTKQHQIMKAKVYTFLTNQVVDDEVFGVKVNVYPTKDEAMKEFNVWRDEELKYAERDGWTVAKNEEGWYEAYLDGEYAGNHSEGFVDEHTVEL